MQRSRGPDHDDAVHALMLASRAFVGLAARSLAAVDADVTLPQFRALVVLAVRRPQRSIDIAGELQVNPSTGTRMVDRLARKGLIRRVRSSLDRRVVQLRLTRKGLIGRVRSSLDRRVVQLRLTRAGRYVVEQVMRRRRDDLIQIVSGTASVWKPVVIRALSTFAEAAGEMPEQEWWLGWSPHDHQAIDDDGEPVPNRR